MNYLRHFGLREPPFGITPDTHYFYACRSPQQALNTLLVAVGNGEGFIKITGEVGTGKTLLCRKFLATLGEGWVSAYVPNPNLDPRSVLLLLAEELGLTIEPATEQYQIMRALTRALLDRARARQRVVLCMDEAQAMSHETLETVRLLTNLETEKRKLMQVVLFGQPELDRKLQSASLRQLLQRITFQHRLSGLARDELPGYLAHEHRRLHARIPFHLERARRDPPRQPWPAAPRQCHCPQVAARRIRRGRTPRRSPPRRDGFARHASRRAARPLVAAAPWPRPGLAHERDQQGAAGARPAPCHPGLPGGRPARGAAGARSGRRA
jgi:type II secretory pathway predicted ATPase ExeA